MDQNFVFRSGSTMRGTLAAVFLGLAFAATPVACEARVAITIDLSSQTMMVDSSEGSYSWPISSARAGYVTPTGHFGVESLQAMHYSRKYDNSPMPHSIFFDGGFAIHGSYETRWLGHPASHGCVRISPANAAVLYRLVQEEGASITIVGEPPTAAAWGEADAGAGTRAARRRRGGRAGETDENPVMRVFGVIFSR
jgi:L,D-transpeptidase catalytic domain